MGKKMGMKNQAEIYQALLDGKKLYNIVISDDYIYLPNGVLRDKKGNKLNGDIFNFPQMWEIYKEPKVELTPRRCRNKDMICYLDLKQNCMRHVELMDEE